MVNKENYFRIKEELNSKNVTLVAVSKTKPVEDILELYDLGQRDFGENYVQELVSKYEQLPKDIRWHFIGHLQRNKVKYIAQFVYLVHGVDSLSLLQEVDKQALKNHRSISCLLQLHIAEEETKYGLSEEELDILLKAIPEYQMSGTVKNVIIDGLMGMASFTETQDQVRKEFRTLKQLFDKYAQSQTSNFKFQTLSMGMSSDYKIAIDEGSNMVRIGSLFFGERV